MAEINFDRGKLKGKCTKAELNEIMAIMEREK